MRTSKQNLEFSLLGPGMCFALIAMDNFVGNGAKTTMSAYK